ncbi:MAG: amino acid permease [Alphaproteobacteria bacterium]|nr:MAG: amino acid permease [Alphaproteobacteria bacterium]
MNDSTSRSVGLVGATSVVVGSMIGSGILIISSKIAVFGGMGLIAWIVASGCAISLAYSFSSLSALFKNRAGIPYYVYESFKNCFLSFTVSWAHWLGLCIGCATVAIAFADYLWFWLPNSAMFLKTFTSLFVVWGLIFLSGRNKVFSIGMITLITLIKVVLLLLIIFFSMPYFSVSRFYVPSREASLFMSVLHSMPLALFAFLGLESATASGDSVKDPSKTLPIATLLGTGIAAIMFVSVHMSVMAVLPVQEQIYSQAPVASVAAKAMGSIGSVLVTFVACFGLLGSINGLLFVCSYILSSSSLSGWVSGRFSTLSKQSKFPIFAGYTSAVVISAIILTYALNLVDVNTLVYSAAFLLVMVYLMGNFAYGVLCKNRFVFTLNLTSCLVLIYGCGLKIALIGMFLIMSGIFLFKKQKKV